MSNIATLAEAMAEARKALKLVNTPFDATICSAVLYILDWCEVHTPHSDKGRPMPPNMGSGAMPTAREVENKEKHLTVREIKEKWWRLGATEMQLRMLQFLENNPHSSRVHSLPIPDPTGAIMEDI